MRRLAALCLVAVLLLGGIATSSPGPDVLFAVAAADDDKDKSGNDKKDQGDNDKDENGDDNRGHGNDDDGVDEDNPGNSKDEEKVEAVASEGYAVDVVCTPDEATSQTDCTFTGVAPDGGKEVGFLQVPAAALCAEVTSTEAEYADPHPNTHVTGYVSRGDEGAVTLTLDGIVTSANTAQYWIKAGGNLLPVTGGGIACEAAGQVESTAAVAEATFTAPDPDTGILRLVTLACADVPADTTGFDWFSQCVPAGGHAFEIGLVDSAERTVTEPTADTGEILVDAAAPGTWEVKLSDTAWCHAESDRVTAESDVVVEGGQQTTVWAFLCESKGV